MSQDGLIKSKVVMTRKAHSCEWCPEPVEKGTLAFYRAYRIGGVFTTGYVHPECAEAIRQACDEEGGPIEFTAQGQPRGVQP